MTKVLRLPDAKRVWGTWKNGGGRTQSVACFPPGADLDHFIWRVSVAEISRGGPFSIFPGVERQLAVISGRVAIWLGDKNEPQILAPETAPLRFSGDVSVDAWPLNGPSLDLNIMTRIGKAVAKLNRIGWREPLFLRSGAHHVLLALTESTLDIGGDSFFVPAFDALEIVVPEGKSEISGYWLGSGFHVLLEVAEGAAGV